MSPGRTGPSSAASSPERGKAGHRVGTKDCTGADAGGGVAIFCCFCSRGHAIHNLGRDDIVLYEVREKAKYIF